MSMATRIAIVLAAIGFLCAIAAVMTGCTGRYQPPGAGLSDILKSQQVDDFYGHGSDKHGKD